MKERIRDLFLGYGAALCGFAAADAFTDAPEGFKPRDIYADCRTVIVFAVPVPRGTALVNPRIVYEHFNARGSVELDQIAFLASNELERTVPGAIAVPIPADNPYDDWTPETKTGKGILSMKHAGVRAGLGALGKSTLLINRRYGSMLCLGAVLTNLELPPDPPAENLCIAGCHRCEENCPAGAIQNGTVNQLLCRENTYATNSRGFGVVNCNLCRVQCPRAFGVPGAE